MNKKTLFLILLLGILVLPLSVLADNNVTIESMTAAAVKTTFYIAGGIVVILWVITGLLFLSASGNPTKRAQLEKRKILVGGAGEKRRLRSSQAD